MQIRDREEKRREEKRREEKSAECLKISSSRDNGYDFIRCTAMMMILIFHLLTSFWEYNYNIPPILNRIISRGSIGFGGIGVALFFMLSGALLIKIYKDKLSLKTFYTKRLIKIEIPQMIGFVCAFCLMYCLNVSLSDISIKTFFISLIGLNYGGHLWAIGEWFTTVIIICYVLFPLLRQCFLKQRLLSSVLIAILWGLNLKFEILTRGDGWFSISNGIMCFWCGMLFEAYKHIFKQKVLYAVYLFVLGFIWYNPITIFGFRYVPCFILSLALFVTLYQIKFTNSFIKYICRYNYELYLVHHRIYILLLPALLNKAGNNYQILIASIFVFLATCFFAEALQKAANYVIEKGNATVSYIASHKIMIVAKADQPKTQELNC